MGHISLLYQEHQQGADSKAESQGLELVPIRNASPAGGGLTYHATAPVPKKILKAFNFALIETVILFSQP